MTSTGSLPSISETSIDPLSILLAEPRGFCAGVERAIEIVERALSKFGPPIYVRHEIVHNRHVVERLKAKGVLFVDNLSEVPTGGITVFSAHGVAQAVEDEASARGLDVIDATCPLVQRIHHEGQRYARQNYDVVLIGHAGHPEVEGTLGRLDGPTHLVSKVEDVTSLNVRDPRRIAYVTQTTLSVDDTRSIIDALKVRFPEIIGPDTSGICYASQNRQRAVMQLAQQVECILVVGGKNSSNSNRLREIAEQFGVPAYLVDDASAVRPEWLEGKKSVGLTAGASAPEDLVQDIISLLKSRFSVDLQTMPGVPEDVRFKLPARLEHISTASKTASRHS